MQITDETTDRKHIIQECSSKGIVIDDKIYKSTIMVSPKNILKKWPVENIRLLKIQHMNDILKIKPKILIIGSGNEQLYLDNKILFALYSNNIGCEIMKTTAACRTYNLLSTDNRNVCSLLFPI